MQKNTHTDFTIEVERSAKVLDGAVVVIDAVSGVQAQTMTVWTQIKNQSIPSVFFVNKMDRNGASFDRAVNSVRDRLGANPVPIQIPFKDSEGNFCGVVDLISMQKIVWEQSEHSNVVSHPVATPLVEAEEPKLYKKAFAARDRMLESIAENDDYFFDIFLNSKEFTQTDVIQSLRRVTIRNLMSPVVSGSALRGKGVELLLNSIGAFLPSPLDRKPFVLVNKLSGETEEVKATYPEVVAYAFKVIYDPSRGRMVYIRMISGLLKLKNSLFNSTKNQLERFTMILQVSADEYKNIDEIGPGGVACIIGLKETVTGDTLLSTKNHKRGFLLDGLRIPKAVYSVAIEPEHTSDLPQLDEALSILTMEDPSLVVETDKESGQTIVRGLGELHIDIICDRLNQQFGIKVMKSRAYVAYRESISQSEDGEDDEEDVGRNDGLPPKRTNREIIMEHTYNRVVSGKKYFATIGCKVEVLPLSQNEESTVKLSPEVMALLNSAECNNLFNSIKVKIQKEKKKKKEKGVEKNIN